MAEEVGFVVPPLPSDYGRDSLRKNPDGFSLIFLFLPQRCSSAPIGEKILFSPKTSFCESSHYSSSINSGKSDAIILAEEVGFEPTVLLRGQRFSRPPHSTALPLLRLIQFNSGKRTSRPDRAERSMPGSLLMPISSSC